MPVDETSSSVPFDSGLERIEITGDGGEVLGVRYEGESSPTPPQPILHPRVVLLTLLFIGVFSLGVVVGATAIAWVVTA